jgi:hypothetical protein
VHASEFIQTFFGASNGSIYLCSLANERGGGIPAEVCGRGDPHFVDELVKAWDKPERGTFFAVNTVRPGETRRCKDNVFEIVCLHADIDFAKIEIEPAQVLQILNELEYPPSLIVSSAHGYHIYFILREAEPATPELILQVEGLLKKLADALGGDPPVCEVARIMRLPGSYNRKNGGCVEVQVVVARPHRYELADLAEWLDGLRVLIPRQCAAKAPDGTGNPFLDAGLPSGNTPPVDIEDRLKRMRHEGPGETSVHQTQLSVTAALLNRGTPIANVVRVVLEATRVAVGAEGAKWNWQREEKDLYRMCEAWLRKRNGSSPDTGNTGTGNGGAGPSPPQHTVDALEDILTMEFKPIAHLVPDLIPAEGVTLLVSRPKVGKSWLLYDLCISAALGREMLGGRIPRQGHSLYLALEDSRKRLRFRAEKLLGYHMGACHGVSLATTWDRVDQGGLDLIRQWVLKTRAEGHTVVAVLVDVLMMIRPLGGERQSVYQHDYMAILGLRTLAADLGLAVVIAHHQRKGAADDLQDTISGTMGIAGAVDCSIVIEKQPNGGFIFDVRGRDIEAKQLAATFDRETCRWFVGGDASEARRSENKEAILGALRDAAPEGLGPADISTETGIKATTVRSALLRMRRDGEVRKAKGKYVAAV